MTKAMWGLLDKPETATLTITELLAFQDSDGSFRLLDSYKGVPMDARVEFCHTPTCVRAAILMREMLSGKDGLTDALENVLTAVAQKVALISILRALCLRYRGRVVTVRKIALNS